MVALMLALLCVFLWAPWASADETVINSKHDLSTFGPGPVRAVEESRVCIFCHVPHNASPAAPLWNRHNPTTHYRIYSSRTTDARIDQPGAASKRCLSCHDGSIALGLTLDRPLTDPIAMTHLYIPTGPADLTNDLSDDHPIGLRYDRALSNRDRQIRPPELVDHRIQLGRRGELECIACHQPHNNELGNFLRITEREGALCLTCHDLDGWRTSSHALSPRTVPVTVTNGERLPYRSMADNACRSCHVPHGAPRRERLLYDRPSRLCLNCHDGIGAKNVLAVSDRRSGHRANRLLELRRSPEGRLHVLHSVECSDCHNPHAVAQNPLRGPQRSAGQGPLIPPAMRDVPGVSLAGLPVATARLYYEVCFRCHADRPVIVPGRIVRERDTGGNVRRQFLPTVASAHPVAFASRRTGEVPSLLPEFRTPRLISCQDCHNNPDAVGAGGTQVNGPHGSRFDFLLVARYETRDFTIESPQAYSLCYQCHDRNSILNDESFPHHRNHVARGRSPCSACHTAHGVSGSTSQHNHLINFDISIVGGERFFVDTGRVSGSCTLTCHGVRHVNFTYGR
ncbi:MAG: cytochrome c3 family protein [Phycisphaerae bacterium]